MLTLIKRLLMLLIIPSIAYSGGSRPPLKNSACGSSSGTLRFYYQTAARYGITGPELEISYILPYDQVQFVSQPDGYQGKYTFSVIAYGSNGRQVAGDNWETKLAIRNYDELRKGGGISSDTLKLSLPPGSYRLIIKAVDENSERTGQAEAKVFLAPPKADTIGLSGLRFMRNVFGKNIPWPRRIYGEGYGDVLVYFQVYPANKDSLELEYVLKQYGGETADRIEVDTMPAEINGGILINLAADSLQNGSYFLTIKATQTGNSASVGESLQIRNPSQMSPKDYQDQIDQLEYIARSREFDSLKNAAPAARESLISWFWRVRDPDTTTAANENRDAYYDRIDYANENYGSIFKPGWKSDMGMVYVMYGKADDIERHPFDIDLPSYEIWYYYQQGLKFVFMDRKGIGYYELIYPTRERILK